jgi:pimeloyl-ACP methyl ester carboxylesterase
MRIKRASLVRAKMNFVGMEVIMRGSLGRLALVAALCGAASSAVWSAPVSWPVPDNVKTVEVNGYPLAYTEAGNGSPVVIIHGAWVDHRLFLPQAAALSRQHRVILVSLRHHHPEPWDGKREAVSLRQHASDVAGLVRALGFDKVHLVGHSMGAVVALEVARTAPDLLRSLALADPAGPPALLGDEALARQRLDGNARLSAAVRAVLDADGDRRAAAARGWNLANGPGAWDGVPPDIQQMLADNIGTAAGLRAGPRLQVSGAVDARRPESAVLLRHRQRASAMPRRDRNAYRGSERCAQHAAAERRVLQRCAARLFLETLSGDASSPPWARAGSAGGKALAQSFTCR